MRSVLAVVFLSLPLVLAGCTSQDPTPTSSTAHRLDAKDVDTQSELGVVQGTVTDLDELPIEGAGVGIRELKRQTRTDAGGFYQFLDVEPGEYTLDVARLGYQSKAIKLTVTAGELTETSIPLEDFVDETAAYSATTNFNGFYECALGTPAWVSACSYPYTAVYYTALGNGVNLTTYGLPEDVQKNPFRYNFTVENNAVEIVSEMTWVPGSAASTQMQLIMSCGDYDPVLDTCSPEYGSRKGTSPLRMEWSATRFEGPTWVMARGYLPFDDVSLAFSQKFELWNTVFYNAEAPQGYTHFVS